MAHGEIKKQIFLSAYISSYMIGDRGIKHQNKK